MRPVSLSTPPTCGPSCCLLLQGAARVPVPCKMQPSFDARFTFLVHPFGSLLRAELLSAQVPSTATAPPRIYVLFCLQLRFFAACPKLLAASSAIHSLLVSLGCNTIPFVRWLCFAACVVPLETCRCTTIAFGFPFGSWCFLPVAARWRFRPILLPAIAHGLSQLCRLVCCTCLYVVRQLSSQVPVACIACVCFPADRVPVDLQSTSCAHVILFFQLQPLGRQRLLLRHVCVLRWWHSACRECLLTSSLASACASLSLAAVVFCFFGVSFASFFDVA